MKPYFKQIKVWDYSSIKEAIQAGTDITDQMDKDDWGICVVFFDKMEDVKLMPTHHTKYILDGKEIPAFEYECSEQAECINVVEHYVDWTESMGVHKNTRLHFQYVGEDISDDQVESVMSQMEEWMRIGRV